jgi:hypothetical protein
LGGKIRGKIGFLGGEKEGGKRNPQSLRLHSCHPILLFYVLINGLKKTSKYNNK